MRHLEKIAMGLAVLSALSGTIFIAVSVFGKEPHASLLVEAAVAAAMSLMALVVSVFFVNPLATEPIESKPLRRLRLREPEPPAEDPRRQVLEVRLHIDPPSHCSQHAVPCTCWSLCGAPPQAQADSPASDEASEAQDGQAPLPVIQRSGKDDCPFRFQALRK